MSIKIYSDQLEIVEIYRLILDFFQLIIRILFNFILYTIYKAKDSLKHC